MSLADTNGVLGGAGILSPGMTYLLSALTAGAPAGYGTCNVVNDFGCDTSHHEFNSEYQFALQLTAVPLPAAAWLLLSGIGALGAMARRARASRELQPLC